MLKIPIESRRRRSPWEWFTLTLHGMAPETGSLCYTDCEALRRHREVPLPGIAVTVHRSGTGSFFTRISDDPSNRSNHSLHVLLGKLSLSPSLRCERLRNRFRWRVTEIRFNLVPETRNSRLNTGPVFGVLCRSTHFRACFIHQKISQEAGS